MDPVRGYAEKLCYHRVEVVGIEVRSADSGAVNDPLPWDTAQTVRCVRAPDGLATHLFLYDLLAHERA